MNAFLTSLGAEFSFSLSDAQNLITAFHEEMRLGLAGKPSSLKMLPAYIGRPSGRERGQFLALDLGGTNLRVLAVALDGRGDARVTAASRFTVSEAFMRGDGDALFDFIARCVALFFEEHPIHYTKPLHLAFTFSFPVAQKAVNAGTLLNWTKGFCAAGVQGRDVVSLLSAALARRGLEAIRVTALANDTVGALMAKSYSDPACDMGVILGTGTNACYPEDPARFSQKSVLPGLREMVINMEWGDFDRMDVNRYDRRLDAATLNPGRQRLEKMVSGMYLGELARLIVCEMIDEELLLNLDTRSFFERDHAVTSEDLSQAAAGGDFFCQAGIKGATKRDRETFSRIARLVSTRAARIAAASIGAVVLWMDPNLSRRHVVAVDGALFAKYPGFPETMKALLAEMFSDTPKAISLCLAPDGSGIGAAVIAAVAADLHSTETIP